MPGTATIRIDALNIDELQALVVSGIALSGALENALEPLLAGDGNPVVVPRQTLAPVQAALDAFNEALADVAEVNEPEEARDAGELVDSLEDRDAGACEDGPGSRPCVAEDDYRTLEEESPTERRARELRA